MAEQSLILSDESDGEDMTAIEKAKKAARKAIESSHYDGVCTITEHRKETVGKTKIIRFHNVVVLENQPCHLSFKTVTSAVQSESAAAVKQTTELFISPDLIIKPGSKITVTQEGVTIDYTCSGVSAVYATHQEIILELWRGYT